MQRLIIEMGMGIDMHGKDYTKAAIRAVQDALRHSSLPVLKAPGTKDAMQIRVTVGVARPDEVDVSRVAAALPHGTPEIVLVEGGLDVADDDGAPDHTIAQAAVEVFLPFQDGWQLRQS